MDFNLIKAKYEGSKHNFALLIIMNNWVIFIKERRLYYDRRRNEYTVFIVSTRN